MTRRIQRLLALVWFVSLGCDFSAHAETQSFSNTTPLTGPATHAGAAPLSLYPSPIVVSGMSGTITKLVVHLHDLQWHRPDDLEVHLVGPTGARIHLMSDAGGTGTTSAGFALTFDDTAAQSIPDAGPLIAGSYRPTSIHFTKTALPSPTPGGDNHHAAPQGTATLANQFNGTVPNGTWNLFVADDVSSGTASGIQGGWSLDITTSDSILPTRTVLISSANPGQTTESVTLTASVTKVSDTSHVTAGTVTFINGTTVLAGPGPIAEDGTASLTFSGLPEGLHTIVAKFHGAADFGDSEAVLRQVITNPTVSGPPTAGSGIQFCNTGSLVVASSAPAIATVYPSLIQVSGLSGKLSKITLGLIGLNIQRPDDLEVLLVGPDGSAFVVLSDVGGTSLAVNGVNLTLDDEAAGGIGDSGGLVSGTFRPSSVHSSATTFPAPAPNSDLQHPPPFGGASFASVFGGKDPNGTWSLYLMDDVTGEGATLTGGWCLQIQTQDLPTSNLTLESTVNPSEPGQSVTFTATVRKPSDGSLITSGNVEFLVDASPVGTGVPLDPEGRARFSTDGLSEGTHTVTAHFLGLTDSVHGSSGAISQEVDHRTFVSGHDYSNPGPLTLSSTSPARASAYPSHVVVSGRAGLVSKVSVRLNGLTIDRPDDLEVLLVGPTGASFVLLSDAGGTSATGGPLDLVLTDDAAIPVPDNGPLAGGNYRPTSYNSTPHAFGVPAPAGPHPEPSPTGIDTLLSTFAGTNPNGTWSLFVLDDVPGGGGSFASGWTLVLETVEYDMGDAPDPAYPTFLANDGPRHRIPASGPILYLGSSVDSEFEANASATADGDGTEDDGVRLPALLSRGQLATAEIEVHGTGGYLNAWIDWNRDGDWLDAGEQIAADLALQPGPFQLSILPPPGLVSGSTFARFRLSSAQGLSPGGLAPDGEVEDYAVELSSNLPPTAVPLQYSVLEGGILGALDPDGLGTPGNPTDDGVLASDSDPNGDGLNAILVNPPAHAVGFLLNPNGTFSYVHDGSETLSDQFTYKVSDGALESGVQQVQIIVLPVNDPPTVQPDSFQRNPGRVLKILASKLLSNDSDPDGPSALRISSVSTPSNQGSRVRILGEYVIYEGDGINGPDSFTYSASDGALEVSGTVSIAVTSSSQPPFSLVSTALFGTERHVVTAGIIGRSYRLQLATDLSGPWIDVEGPAAIGTISTSGVVLLKDLTPRTGTLFYRAVQQ